MLQTKGLSALGVSFSHMGAILAEETSSDQDISKWLDRLYVNASHLGERQISSLQWQEVMDQIYGTAPIDLLKKRLDFVALRKLILDRIPAHRGQLFHRVELPGSAKPKTPDGREPDRVLITKVAHVL